MVSLARKAGRPQGFRPNQYRVEEEAAYLLLSDQGPAVEAVIDVSDFARVVSLMRWQEIRRPHTSYAFGRFPIQEGKRKAILLHRFIVDAPSDMEVDHINGNGLDCRQSNLRLATHGQNMQNRHGLQGRSGVKNVTWNERLGRWQVIVWLNKKQYSGGVFDDIEAASLAASSLRQKLHSHCAENTVRPPQINMSGGAK